jgi:hypothetical protein
MQALLKKEALEKAQGLDGGRSGSPAIPATMVFVLCVIFAMLIGDDTVFLSKLHLTGASEIDRYLTQANPTIMGDKDIDRLIVIFGRGLALFLVTGLVPLVSWVFSQMLGRQRIHPLVICWLVIAASSFLVYLPLHDIWQALRDMVGK